MDKFFLLKPFLKLIQEGGFFKNCFFWLVRILAGLTVVAFLYASFNIWDKMSFDLPAEFIIIAVVIQLVLLLLTYVIVNILWIRADDIQALPVSTDYIVIPVIVVFVKMTGEILGAFFTLLGIVSGLAIIAIGKLPALPMLDFFAGNSGLAGGLIAIIGGPLYGILMMTICYYAAEQLGVFVDIARNTRR